MIITGHFGHGVCICARDLNNPVRRLNLVVFPGFQSKPNSLMIRCRKNPRADCNTKPVAINERPKTPIHTADSPALLTAYNLQDGRVVQQTRVEPWNKRAIKQANNV